MMVGLFIIYLACLFLIIRNHRKTAFWLVIANLVLCFFMLLHHATDVLQIRL